VYLTFQEYFEKPGTDGKRWGKPLAALLGAFDAQMDLGIAAIGGKDSMSGSFEKLDVPPTLVSFAVTTAKTGDIISSEFKQAGNTVILLEPERDERGLPVTASLLALYKQITGWIREGKIVSCRTIETGGSLASVMKMALGNGLGFTFEKDWELSELETCLYGSFIAEVTVNLPVGRKLGTVEAKPAITWRDDSVTLKELRELGRNKLEKVYPTLNPEWTPEDRAEADACWPSVRAKDQTESFSFEAKSWPAPAVRTARPRVLIPAFPGTNCEIDSARAMEDAGAEAKIFVVRNRTAEEISHSAEAFADEVRKSQMIFIPGGFSGGDEPDGSAKFITAFFRNGEISEAVTELLEKRDGLMCGICNGFQALIKLGLVPYGKIIETDAHCPTLTFNTIGRHQSRIVRTRIASTLSPWLRGTRVGEVYSVPISHGEGRFLAEESLIRELAAKGQIATQYVDLEDQPSMDLRFNPNGSLYAIEGITSPDGRIFGKMGHSERTGKDLYKNVPGNYNIGMFRSAVEYFK
jgi:phosphoribosylformylglycinamidine synthase